MNAAYSIDIRKVVQSRANRREQFIHDVKIVLLTAALFFAFFGGQSLFN